MRNEDWLDRLFKKRWGRFVWVFGLIVVIALVWGTGTWLASISLVLPMLDVLSIMVGFLYGIIILIFLYVIACGFYSLGKWLWNG